MRRIGIIFLLSLLLVSCGKELENATDKSEAEKQPTLQEQTAQEERTSFVDYDPGKELPEYKGVWAFLEGNSCYVYVARATEKYVWFSYGLSGYMRAEKQEDGKYHYYQYYNKIGIGYADVMGQEGVLELKDGTLYAEICESPNLKSELEKGTRLQEESDILVNAKTMDVFQYLDDYDKAYKYKEKNGLFYATLGKAPDSECVSSFKITRFIGVSYYYEQILDYRFGNIDFTSTKKQCDQEWGAPIGTEEKKHGMVYLYQYEDYQIHVYFSKGGSIQNISLYLNSQEEAMKKYQIGDFVLQGSRVIRYKGKKNSKVIFPKEAVAVGTRAFEKSKQVKEIYIPKEIYLEPEAFACCRAKLVTFEEGRTLIPRESFQSFGFGGDGTTMTIRLPKSTKTIEMGAFLYSYEYGEKPVRLILNDGLEKIESMGIYGLEVDLPNSIKEMEEAAYGVPVKKVYLPEGISGLAEGCIQFIPDDDCHGGNEKNYVVYVPKSVDLNGKNIVSNGVCKPLKTQKNGNL